MVNVLSIENEIKIVEMLNKSIILLYVSACKIDFMGMAWAWSTSEFLAYPNGSRFPLGQRGSDNRGWTVLIM